MEERAATSAACGEPKASREVRWSARRKEEVVLRLLRGESLDTLARETGQTAGRISRWREDFLAGGREGLKAMVVGAFVRGLSMRDVESLCDEAGMGRISRSSAAWICRELRDRFRAFMARDLSEIRLVALFLDAIYLPVRLSGAKEGVLCPWGVADVRNSAFGRLLD